MVSLETKIKTCSQCLIPKPLKQFYRHAGRSDGFLDKCKDCTKANEKIDIERYRANGRKKQRSRRARALAALGGKCVRCGFDDYRALQIDHKNGGGSLERRAGYQAKAILQVLRGEVEKFQLLCANCNWIKRFENGEHGKRLAKS